MDSINTCIESMTGYTIQAAESYQILNYGNHTHSDPLEDKYVRIYMHINTGTYPPN